MKRIVIPLSFILCLLLFGGVRVRDNRAKPPVPLVQINTEMIQQLAEKYKLERRERLQHVRESSLMSPAAIRLTEEALITINHPWTTTPVINASVTMAPPLERRLFSDNAVLDYDLLYFNSPDPEQAIAFFLDPIWDRMIFAKKSENWIKSWGDRPELGHPHMARPSALTVDISPNNAVYIADTDNGRILRFLVGEQDYLGFTVPGIWHPIDICLPVGVYGLANGIWVADDWAGKLVEFTRPSGVQVLKTVDRYTIGGNTYMLTRPRAVAAHNWPWPRLGFLDGVRNAFVVCDPSAVSGTTAAALSVTEFDQPGSLLARIGVDATNNWWVADPGLDMIHTFEFDGEYLASLAPPIKVQTVSMSPAYFDGSYLNQPLEIFTAERWGDTQGLRAYYPGADAVNLQIQETEDLFRFTSTLTNSCQLNVKIVRASDGVVIQDLYTGGTFATHRTDEVAKASLQFGDYKFRIEVLPMYNANYGQYQVPWLIRELPFTYAPPSGILSSTSPTATATNNERKIAQSENGRFCVIYESENHIWASTSIDAVNWTYQFRVSDEPSPGEAYNKYPSIVVNANIAEIIWQEQTGTGGFAPCYIKLRRFNLQTGVWGPIELVGSFEVPEENYEATPVIAANSLLGGQSKAILWREPQGLIIHSYQDNTWSSPQLVPATHENCFYPNIVSNGQGYCLSWEDRDATSINYVETSLNGSTWSFTNAAAVSPVGWYSNQRPSMAFGSPNKVSVAWQSIDNVVEGVSVHVRQKTFNQTNWGNITSYSIGTGGYQPHPAIGSYGGNGKLSLVWNIANNVYVATYNGSCWSVPGILASGTNGGSECSINSSTPSLLAALWRKPDGGISITTNGVNPNWECGAEEESIAGKYSVGGDSSVVPVPYRLNRHGLVEMPRAIGGSNKSVRGTMAFEIAGMKLVTPEGVETLEYEDLNALPHGRSELSSKPFTVSEANSQLIFAGAAYGKRLAIPEDSLRTVAQPLALVRLREHADGNPREQVWRLPFSNLSSIRDSTYGEYREFTVDLAEYGGKELYVEVEMLGRALRVAPLIDDDYLILPGQMHVTAGNSFAKAADKTLPTAYALYQNYPNPFNPTTTIRFDLPEAQIVSLKVFNVLGQLVTELANAEFDAGEHSVVADFTNLPSGMYFYSITAGSFTDVKKLLLIR